VSDCAFCRIGQGEIDEDLVAYRSENVFAVPALKQRQNNHIPGQVLHHVHVHVIPRFEDDGFRMPDPELCEAPRDVRLARAAALRKALQLGA
jgi:histidine triad (HIT) family protein